MTWHTYRGYQWTVVPGMCCPSLIIRWEGSNQVLLRQPNNGPDYELDAMRWIDAMCEEGN